MVKVVLLLLLAVVIGAAPAAAEDGPKRSVILIPGILGSKLCGPDGKVLWGATAKASLANFQSLEITSGSDGIKPCGIVDRVQVLGPFYSVAAYSGLLKAMAEWQLVEGRNLFVFDYDWRLSNVDNAEALERFVLNKLGPDQTFNIVAHSMGGLITRLYLERPATKPRVEKVIYLGTPFLGSMSTLGTLSEGWGKIENWFAGGTGTIRQVALSFPSLLELLPRYDDCCSLKGANGKYKAIDVFDPEIWKANAWLPTQMRDGPRFVRFSEHLKRARTLSPVLRTPPAGITEIRFASDTRSTRFIFAAYEGATEPSPSNWHFSLERGDATVPAWSAAREPTMRSLEGSLQSFGEHSTIFDDDWVRSQIKRELFTASASVDRPIAGRGYPVITVTVGGLSREWSLERIQISPHDTYVDANTPVTATVGLKFSGDARDFDSGLYAPRILLRQNNVSRPMAIRETTTEADKGAQMLTFAGRGDTGGLDEGVVELVVELPFSQPESLAREFVVLLK